MAHRRTREEKVQAVHRYVVEVKNNEKIKLNLQSAKSSNASANFYYPELTLPTTTLKADLTKTLIVAILALILQFSLAVYLQKGGWSHLQLFIDKIF